MKAEATAKKFEHTARAKTLVFDHRWDWPTRVGFGVVFKDGFGAEKEVILVDKTSFLCICVAQWQRMGGVGVSLRAD